MTGPKTNEREGTRAVLRHARVSPYKVREVLDLVRNQPVGRAEEILRFCERDPAILVGKLLRSAVANAETNDSMDPEELFVSACYADEGTTVKRWRPRARGRATRIRKRTCHVTIIVSRLPAEKLARLRAKQAADDAVRRARRVAGAREGGRRRRRAGGEGEPTAAEVAEIEEEEGIVDEDAAAIAQAEAELAAGDEVGTVAEHEGPAEEAGIVDEDEAAVEAAQAAAPAEAPSAAEIAAVEEEEGIVDQQAQAAAQAEEAAGEADTSPAAGERSEPGDGDKEEGK